MESITVKHGRNCLAGRPQRVLLEALKRCTGRPMPILVVTLALLGGVATAATLWSHGAIIALAAAPVGASLLVAIVTSVMALLNRGGPYSNLSSERFEDRLRLRLRINSFKL